MTEQSMLTYEYRQGRGDVKIIKAMGPVQREDGSFLSPLAVSHYLMTVKFNGGSGTESAVNLVDDLDTVEYDGQFDEILVIDDHSPGTYEITYKTVDIDGLESVPSNALVITILPPFVRPNPPKVV